MQRLGIKVPLLIGGATTSRAHTAIKISPHYQGPIVHVGDASLVIEVCNKLLSPTLRSDYVEQLKNNYTEIRERFLKRQEAPSTLLSLTEARTRKFQTNWNELDIANPERLGVFNLDFTLEEIIPFIDWSPFFWTWELKGTYPKILGNATYGAEAKKIFNDAQVLLKNIVDNKRFKPKAVVGIFEAYSQNEDVVVHSNDKKTTLHFLRQQKEKLENNDSKIEFNYCLADFIAPKEIGKKDYLGAFAVTAGHEVESYAKSFQAVNDDYSAIMVKALADRLAEALAELTHKKVREIFSFGLTEKLSNEDFIKEKYRGIRPAPGYPACPDHTEKELLWDILEAEKNTGITLTESFAMNPPSSVSGFYFNHPGAKYFNVGNIDRDQVEDYAKRKNMPLVQIEKWLAPNLNYDS
jgi:5-methyltetrahydrofolate--homocysteine methyltransferase